LEIDYQKTLDDILCSPDFSEEFDRLAQRFGPSDMSQKSREYRLAALSIRKRMHAARTTAAKTFDDWRKKKLETISIDDCRSSRMDIPGAFVLRHGEAGIYAYQGESIREQVKMVLDNPSWEELKPDSIIYERDNQGLVAKYALKSALVTREHPLLNCRQWISDLVPSTV
jgi:hypothetical protein